ncbi:MAG: DUF3180 domain-containing protein [Cellulomonadaceae bacterium]
MRVTRIRSLILLALAVTVVGWGALDLLESRGIRLSPVHWMVAVVLVLLSAGVLIAGWAVRQYQRGKRPGLDGVRAARTFVLAKAAAVTGALLAGWYAAQTLTVIGDLMIEPRRHRAIAAAVAALLALGLSVVGLVVERWCRVRGDGSDDKDDGAGALGVAQPEPSE